MEHHYWVGYQCMLHEYSGLYCLIRQFNILHLLFQYLLFIVIYLNKLFRNLGKVEIRYAIIMFNDI